MTRSSLSSATTLREAFKEAIGDRIEKICAGLGVEIDYAFQALENVPEGLLPCPRAAQALGHRPGRAGLQGHY